MKKKRSYLLPIPTEPFSKGSKKLDRLGTFEKDRIYFAGEPKKPMAKKKKSEGFEKSTSKFSDILRSLDDRKRREDLRKMDIPSNDFIKGTKKNKKMLDKILKRKIK